MMDPRIGEQPSIQIANHLVYLHQNASIILPVERNRLHVRIDFAPLLRPVGRDRLLPLDKPSLERPRPSHIRSHQRKGGIDLPSIESRVGRTEQIGFWRSGMSHGKEDAPAATAVQGEFPLSKTPPSRIGAAPLKKNGRATAASPRRGSDPPYPNVRHGNNRESNESRE